MKHVYFFLVLIFCSLISTFSQSQCINSSGSSSAQLTAIAGSKDSIVCNMATEYGIWIGILASYSYSTVSSSQTDFITVRSGSPSGTVVAFGKQPLTWTAKNSDVHFIHINTNETCAVESICRSVVTVNNGPSDPCNNSFNPGSVIASVKSACTGSPFQLSLSGSSVAKGLTYQWQSSTNGTTYSSIPTAINSTCTISQTMATYYQCIVTCSSGTSATAIPLTVDMGTCATMSNGSINSCTGVFYDSGGAVGNYQNGEIDTLTITPSIPNTYLQIVFNSFDLENLDSISVYNGNNVLSPLMGTFSANPSAITSSASDGSLTFVFKSANSKTSSGWEGIIGCITPPSNNIVCSPKIIPVNGSVAYFDNGAATVETNENTITPPQTGFNTRDGWGLSSLDHTVWFTFNAPTSGNVIISSRDVEINGQIAVYKVVNCNDFSSFQLIAANDNDVDYASESPRFTICGLTPGNTYYLLYDSGNGYSSGPFSIAISELSLNAGISKGVIDVCGGDTVDLFEGISDYDIGGVWKETIPTFGIAGSIWNTSGVAYQMFDFQYIIRNGCLADTALSQVRIFGPSHAGKDGVITACKEETINLIGGLSGNVDLGGVWYNPSNQPLAGNTYTNSGIPGQFNFDYIASNKVCPDDTSNILVIVSECVAGIEDVGIESLLVYPNPSRGVFYIRGTNDESLDLRLTDMYGRNVSFLAMETENGIQIEMTKASPGLFILQLKTKGIASTHKISIE